MRIQNLAQLYLIEPVLESHSRKPFLVLESGVDDFPQINHSYRNDLHGVSFAGDRLSEYEHATMRHVANDGRLQLLGQVPK
jgi:hypothetical protein